MNTASSFLGTGRYPCNPNKSLSFNPHYRSLQGDERAQYVLNVVIPATYLEIEENSYPSEIFLKEILNRIYPDIDNTRERTGMALNDMCTSMNRGMIMNGDFKLLELRERKEKKRVIAEKILEEKERLLFNTHDLEKYRKSIVISERAQVKNKTKCENFDFCKKSKDSNLTIVGTWLKCPCKNCRH
jgi:hypothetical protein